MLLLSSFSTRDIPIWDSRNPYCRLNLKTDERCDHIEPSAAVVLALTLTMCRVVASNIGAR